MVDANVRSSYESRSNPVLVSYCILLTVNEGNFGFEDATSFTVVILNSNCGFKGRQIDVGSLKKSCEIEDDNMS